MDLGTAPLPRTGTRTGQRVQHEVRLRLAQVARVEALSPLMRRVFLCGAELEGFVSAAADDHVKLFVPAPGQDKPVLPTRGPTGLVYPEGATLPAVRDYTPRRFDPARRELCIDFVLHGDGPAAGWAAAAVPGAWLGVGGPRGSLLPPDGYGCTLLAGDETALPAIERRLAEMAPGTRVVAVIEVADGRERRELDTRADAEVVWLPRDGVPAGSGSLLDEALAGLELDAADTYAWLAGEVGTVRRLRRHLVDGRGLGREQVRAAGYWRRGSEGAHERVED